MLPFEDDGLRWCEDEGFPLFVSPLIFSLSGLSFLFLFPCFLSVSLCVWLSLSVSSSSWFLFFSRPFVLFSGFLWSSFPGSLGFLSVPWFSRFSLNLCSFVPFFCSRPPLLVLLRSFVFSFSFILLLCSFLHCFEHTLTSCFSIPRLPTQPKKYINLHLHTFGQYI